MTREHRLQLAGAIFISVFLVTFDNVPLVELLHRPSYYRDLGITVVAALLLFRYINWATAWLDQRLGWLAPGRRVAAQAVLGWVGACLLAYGMAFVQYRLIDAEHVFGTESFRHTEYPVIALFNLFINGLYSAVAYYNWQEKLRPQPTESLPPKPAFAVSLLAIQGQRTIHVPVNKVALLSVENGITWLFTFDNSRYHLDEPLQQIMEQLDPERFFRVNRQNIVQLSACFSYQPAEYGKMRLRLIPPFQQELLISQKTAPAFRRWMAQHSRAT